MACILTWSASCALSTRGSLDGGAPRSSGSSVRMFDRVDELVRTRHYSPTLNGVDWPELCRRYRPLMAVASNEDEAYRTVNEMLQELRDSHTYARRPGRALPGDRARARDRAEGGAGTPPREVRVLDDGVVYLRFAYFNDVNLRWLRRQVAAHADAPGIIIDLRGNSGGLIRSTQRAVGMFFPTRVPMGYVIRRNGRRSVERSRGPEVYSGPLAVLVGRHSHSSAEVFAHVMQAHARAVVVGHATPGNVLGSRRYRLPDGGYLRLSITDFRGLDDRQLEGRGVRPDIDVGCGQPQPAGAESHDVAVAAALRELGAE